MQTVPAVMAALSMTDDDERFLRILFLAAAGAAGLKLPQEMQARFETLAVTPAVG